MDFICIVLSVYKLHSCSEWMAKILSKEDFFEGGGSAITCTETKMHKANNQRNILFLENSIENNHRKNYKTKIKLKKIREYQPD